MKNNFSVISFAQDIKTYIFNSTEKFHKWGIDNDSPKKILQLYDSVPEHESAINFTNINVVGEGLVNENILDFWNFQKLALDYLIFGGYTLKVTKLRNGSAIYEYIDISKCRFSPKKDKIGYCEDWKKAKLDIEWFDMYNSVSTGRGVFIYYFKNNKSRELYPRPHYLSAFKSIDTACSIATYHNSNANNGFTPNTIINFNNGSVDEDTKALIEKQITEKFTGPDAKRFLLSFNESADNAITISKLDNDNLDQKFADLQKWVQNQIIVAHQITSGTLIGIRPENQGFTSTEYEESLSVFKNIVVKSFKNELEYSLSKLTGVDVKIKETGEVNQPSEVVEPENNDTITNNI